MTDVDKNITIDTITNNSGISEIRATHLPSKIYVCFVGEHRMIKGKGVKDELLDRLKIKLNKEKISTN